MEHIFSRKQMIRTGFPYDDYKFIERPGQYTAILDNKCWGHNNLLLFFTLVSDNYRTIVTRAWSNSSYQSLRNTPVGSKVLLLFKQAKTTGNVYLAAADTLETETEDFYEENI